MKNKMETKTKILVFIFKFYYGTCSHHIGESATFVNLVEHSWYICFNTQLVVILYVIVGPQ